MQSDPLSSDLEGQSRDSLELEEFNARLRVIEQNYGDPGVKFALSMFIPIAFNKDMLTRLWMEEFRHLETPEGTLSFLMKTHLFDEVGVDLYEFNSIDAMQAFRIRQEALSRLDRPEIMRVAIMLERISKEYMKKEDEDMKTFGWANYISALSISDPEKAQTEFLKGYNAIKEDELEETRLRALGTILGLKLEL